MLDHISIPVEDLTASSQFYDEVLAPLGWQRLVERPGAIGYGDPRALAPSFWILRPPSDAELAAAGRGFHVSFSAESHAVVQAFHSAALQAGAKNGGDPGPRPHYVGNFYGCFVFDLDGFKIEATARTP